MLKKILKSENSMKVKSMSFRCSEEDYNIVKLLEERVGCKKSDMFRLFIEEIKQESIKKKLISEEDIKKIKNAIKIAYS